MASRALLAFFLLLSFSALVAVAAEPTRPTMDRFMGLCGHYHFDGPTYAPLARHVRNYHSLNWDLDVTKPYRSPPYPFALNRVNWRHVYGGWRGAGFDVIASVMIGTFEPEQWVAPEEAAYRFGKDYAAFFGPSGEGLLQAAELGNEPGAYDDELYTRLARAMARGMREGDPDLKVATCNVSTGESGDYAKSLSCFEGWLDLIDVITVHNYAIKNEWPNRRRTYPEDPECDFIESVRKVLEWRDRNAPGKPVWVTEFGWDSHQADGAPLQEGVPIHKRPSVISRPRQAQFLLRAYLIFARLGADRAYMYWYMDGGAEKGLHNGAGLITSPQNKPAEGKKQPAYYALAALRRNLGDYRFHSVVSEDSDGAWAYLFRAPGPDRAALVYWSPTMDGEPRTLEVDLAAVAPGDHAVDRLVEPALCAEGDRELPTPEASGSVELEARGTPRFLFLTR
ncbi:MAG: hypothetical protein ACOC7T_02265 [Planctomycetota bacterium]